MWRLKTQIIIIMVQCYLQTMELRNCSVLSSMTLVFEELVGS